MSNQMNNNNGNQRMNGNKRMNGNNNNNKKNFDKAVTSLIIKVSSTTFITLFFTYFVFKII